MQCQQSWRLCRQQGLLEIIRGRCAHSSNDPSFGRSCISLQHARQSSTFQLGCPDHRSPRCESRFLIRPHKHSDKTQRQFHAQPVRSQHAQAAQSVDDGAAADCIFTEKGPAEKQERPGSSTIPQSETVKPLGAKNDPITDEVGSVGPVSVTIDIKSLSSMLQTLKFVRSNGLPDHTPLKPANERGKASATIHRWDHDHMKVHNLKLQEHYAQVEKKRTLKSHTNLPITQPEQQREVLRLVSNNDVTVVVAETGSGKTTQLPKILLEKAISDGVGGYCNIICTQPRRISATSVARRVAEEQNVVLGTSVGYLVRFDYRPPTQYGSITYCTTRLLLKKLQQDPSSVFSRYSHIIVDEVHVRDTATDILLATLRDLLQMRKAKGLFSPALVLMSATIDSSAIVQYFQNSSDLTVGLLDVPGRAHHVQVQAFEALLPKLQQRHAEEFAALDGASKPSQIMARKYLANELGLNKPDILDTKLSETDEFVPISITVMVILHVLATTAVGDVLVFLPGMSEIDAVEVQLLHRLPSFIQNRTKIFKLHSSLYGTNNQVFDQVPSDCRRLILATNIAETSITLPNVVHVIDPGKVKESTYNQMTQTYQFRTAWISKASSMQRRGRAGRIQSGFYYPIFTQKRFDMLEEAITPELLRSDLTMVCLDAVAQYPIKDARLQTLSSSENKRPSILGSKRLILGTLDPPDSDKVDSAMQELKALQAVTPQEKVTPLGMILAKIPLHPARTKAILLAILFRCVHPLLTMGTIDLDFPLLNHPTSRGTVATIRKRYAGSSADDRIATLRAFQKYADASNREHYNEIELLEREGCVQRESYMQMDKTAKQASGLLMEAGLLPPKLMFYDAESQYSHSMFLRPDSENENHAFQSSTFNVNSENVELIKALALTLMGSRFAVLQEKFWRTSTDPKCLLGPRSVNFRSRKKAGPFKESEYRKQGTLLAYSFRKTVPTDKYPWLLESSIVTPLAALLFGPTPTLEGKDTLVIGGWLRYRIVHEDESRRIIEHPAVLVYEFRKALDRFLTLAFADLMDISRYSSRNYQQDRTDYNRIFHNLEHPLRIVFTECLTTLFRNEEGVKEEINRIMMDTNYVHHGEPSDVADEMASRVGDKEQQIESTVEEVDEQVELSETEDQDVETELDHAMSERMRGTAMDCADEDDIEDQELFYAQEIADEGSGGTSPQKGEEATV